MTLAFPNGNGTALVQPSLLQQLQAAIGCTLEVPLEQVVLTNVTQVIGGAPTQIPFVPPTLNSNGTVVCLVPATWSPQRRLALRALQSASVEVSITILSPPTSLTLLGGTELATLVADSAILQLVSTMVGSSPVSVASVGDTIGTAPTPPSDAVATAASPSNAGLITGLSVFSGFCLVAAGVAAGLYYRSRKQPVRSRVILTVENVFSEPSVSAKRIIPEDRVEFSPLSIRQPLV